MCRYCYIYQRIATSCYVIARSILFHNDILYRILDYIFIAMGKSSKTNHPHQRQRRRHTLPVQRKKSSGKQGISFPKEKTKQVGVCTVCNEAIEYYIRHKNKRDDDNKKITLSYVAIKYKAKGYDWISQNQLKQRIKYKKKKEKSDAETTKKHHQQQKKQDQRKPVRPKGTTNEAKDVKQKRFIKMNEKLHLCYMG